MSLSEAFQKLVIHGSLKPIGPTPKPANPLSNYNSRYYCAYHQGRSHSTDRCIRLCHEIQDLIDNEVIANPSPNITTNLLPNHQAVPPPDQITIFKSPFDPTTFVVPITQPQPVVHVEEDLFICVLGGEEVEWWKCIPYRECCDTWTNENSKKVQLGSGIVFTYEVPTESGVLEGNYLLFSKEECSDWAGFMDPTVVVASMGDGTKREKAVMLTSTGVFDFFKMIMKIKGPLVNWSIEERTLENVDEENTYESTEASTEKITEESHDSESKFC